MRWRKEQPQWQGWKGETKGSSGLRVLSIVEEEILKDTKCVVDANNDNVEHERKNKNRANTSEENDKDCELGENQKGFDDREGSTKDKRWHLCGRVVVASLWTHMPPIKNLFFLVS